MRSTRPLMSGSGTATCMCVVQGGALFYVLDTRPGGGKGKKKTPTYSCKGYLPGALPLALPLALEQQQAVINEMRTSLDDEQGGRQGATCVRDTCSFPRLTHAHVLHSYCARTHVHKHIHTCTHSCAPGGQSGRAASAQGPGSLPGWWLPSQSRPHWPQIHPVQGQGWHARWRREVLYGRWPPFRSHLRCPHFSLAMAACVKE